MFESPPFLQALVIAGLLISVGGCGRSKALVCNSFVDLADDKVAAKEDLIGCNGRFEVGEPIIAVLPGYESAGDRGPLTIRLRALDAQGRVVEEYTVGARSSERSVLPVTLRFVGYREGEYSVIFSGLGDVLARADFEVRRKGAG